MSCYFDKIVWWALEEIRKESYASKGTPFIGFIFAVSDGNKIPLQTDQERALRFLCKIGVIKFLDSITENKGLFAAVKAFSNFDPYVVVGYRIEILEGFHQIYEQFKKGQINCDQLLKISNQKVLADNEATIANPNEVIEYNRHTWDIFYKNKSIHHFYEGSIREIFRMAFDGEKVEYEIPHNKVKQDKKSLEISIKNFKLDLQKKLQDAQAPKKLLDDFLIRIYGGVVQISPCFILKS